MAIQQRSADLDRKAENALGDEKSGQYECE
jgi:hypothetical protein